MHSVPRLHTIGDSGQSCRPDALHLQQFLDRRKRTVQLAVVDSSGNVPSDWAGAPVPVPASMIDLNEFNALNKANLDFVGDLKAAEAQGFVEGVFCLIG